MDNPGSDLLDEMMTVITAREISARAADLPQVVAAELVYSIISSRDPHDWISAVTKGVADNKKTVELCDCFEGRGREEEMHRILIAAFRTWSGMAREFVATVRRNVAS